MTLTFAVPNPCSTNHAYGRSGQTTGRRGMYLTVDGRRFKDALTGAALAARSHSQLATDRGWPSDPWRVAKARVSYQLVNYRGDTDGPRKLIRDALEGVLYANDRVVEDGPAPFATKDEYGKRVVIQVDLLAYRSAHEAEQLRLAAERRAQQAPRRRRASLPGPVQRALLNYERNR